MADGRGPKSWGAGLSATASPELVAAGASVRRLVDALLRVDGSAETLGAARETLEALAERVEGVACGGDTLRLGREDEPPDARPYYIDGVLLPAHHPLAALPEIGTEDGVTRGRVRFGVVFEGPPGCVHGGLVASFFDQILGYHTLELGLPAMTASLSVQYRRPTPLFRDLAFEVRIDGADGRKLDVVGELRDLEADTVTAEAAGLFVLPGSATTDLLRGLVRHRD